MKPPERKSWSRELEKLRDWHEERIRESAKVSDAVPGRAIRAAQQHVHAISVAEIDRRLER